MRTRTLNRYFKIKELLFSLDKEIDITESILNYDKNTKAICIEVSDYTEKGFIIGIMLIDSKEPIGIYDKPFDDVDHHEDVYATWVAARDRIIKVFNNYYDVR